MIKEKKKNQTRKRRFFILLRNSLILFTPAIFTIFYEIVVHRIIHQPAHPLMPRIFNDGIYRVVLVGLCILLIVMLFRKSQKRTHFFAGLFVVVLSSIISISLLISFVIEEELYLDDTLYILGNVNTNSQIVLFDCDSQICKPQIADNLGLVFLNADIYLEVGDTPLIHIHIVDRLGTRTFTYDRRTRHLSHGNYTYN